MGGRSQFFDFNQVNSSRKFFTQKRHNDGLEAPRNSLEFPMEASHGYHFIHEDIPVKHLSTKRNNRSTNIKSLTNEDLPNKSVKECNTPGVVARLMGMDTLPCKIKPSSQEQEFKDEILRDDVARKVPILIDGFNDNMPLSLIPFKQAKKELLPYCIKRDSCQQIKNPRLTNPQPREHPQEELLQKFKKDFEAWQTSRAWERSRALELDNGIRQAKDSKILAQENLKREKTARNADAKKNSARNIEPSYYVPTGKPKIATNDIFLRDRAKTSDTANSYVGRFDKEPDRTSSPTRIVILKPCSEGILEKDGQFTIREEGSMEDFLEEVRRRLKYEIQGKATTRGIGFETASDRSSDPKQIARHIAKQARDSVTMDLGTTLVRSESTRSYRSEVRFNVSDSCEFINRDTRMSERLKNVLKNEADGKIPSTSDGGSGLRLKPMYDFSGMDKRVSHLENKKSTDESKTRSFRREHKNGKVFDSDEMSPRNLVRSLSAPVSGTAFGKLLLEDQHVLTGAHIRRKHEASEHASAEMRKNRKDGFNLKDKVSNLRHNLTLKGNFFRKKARSVSHSYAKEFDPVEPFVTTPSVVMNLGISLDNFTEVPPSPASVTSSSHDDFCRPGHPSPDSPLELPFMEDHSSLIVSEEFNTEFREKISTSEQIEEATLSTESNDDEPIEVQSHLESYAKSILITAGLYESHPFNQSFSRLDPRARPIPKWVFEKVEEAYSRAEVGPFLFGDTKIGRKMFFDLINEALLGKGVSSPGKVPHGRLLLNELLQQIRVYSTSPRVDESGFGDGLVAWDLRMTPWPSISHEEVEAMGREMECVIIGELIDELVFAIRS